MIKRAIIITLVLNSIILVGIPAGHGYGVMIMVEFVAIPFLIENGIVFTEKYPFESSILLIVLFSLISKIILIVSLFYKNMLEKKRVIYFGLILLLISFIGVVYRTWNYDDFLFVIMLGSGIPFLMYFGRVIYLMNKESRLKKL